MQQENKFSEIAEEPSRRRSRLEVGGLLLLGGLALFFIVTSWRKWPDPLIDFGRELYLPWRLSEGAMLYRDIDHHYGPLSHYFNAALFRLFGPGLMVLVTANLAIFVGIAAAIYALCRRAWGAGAAIAGTALFISVFGFSQLVPISNYNYAAPYSHEGTHGLLVCLLLLLIFNRWVTRPTAWWSFLAGLMLGLAAVLKLEIFFAAGSVTVVALVGGLRRKEMSWQRAGLAWFVGALLPTLLFVIGFATSVPWTDAVLFSCRGWSSVFGGNGFVTSAIQQDFLGLDKPDEHLVDHTIATLCAISCLSLIGGLAWLADRSKSGGRWLWSGILIAGIFYLSCFQIGWREIGRCLFGLLLFYLGSRFFVSPPLPKVNQHDRIHLERLLLVVLALALMSRMVLNGRIYQYGFLQAALAGSLVPTMVIGELPERLSLGSWGRGVVVAGIIALLVPGVAKLTKESQQLLQLKTFAVGEGRDQFYAYPPRVEDTGELVQHIVGRLRVTDSHQTVLVLPEGVMLNYLARRSNSVTPLVASLIYYSAAMASAREEESVQDLNIHPPDWVVIISRDLREYHVQHYGEAPGRGQQILRWVSEHYERVDAMGGDPLDPIGYGSLILKRRSGIKPSTPPASPPGHSTSAD